MLEFVAENVSELSASLADSVTSREQAIEQLKEVQASMAQRTQREALYDAIQKNSDVIQELKHALKEKRGQYDALYLKRTKNFFLPSAEQDDQEEQKEQEASSSSSLSDEEWKLKSVMMEKKEAELEETQQEAQDLLAINNRLHCFRVKKASVRRGVELVVDLASGLSIAVSCSIQQGKVRSIQAHLSSDPVYMNTVANLRRKEKQKKLLLLSLSEAIAQPLIVERCFQPLEGREVSIESFRQVLKATSHLVLSLRRVQQHFSQWCDGLSSSSPLEGIEFTLSPDSPFMLDITFQENGREEGATLALPLRVILESGGEELTRLCASLF